MLRYNSIGEPTLQDFPPVACPTICRQVFASLTSTQKRVPEADFFARQSLPVRGKYVSGAPRLRLGLLVVMLQEGVRGGVVARTERTGVECHSEAGRRAGDGGAAGRLARAHGRGAARGVAGGRAGRGAGRRARRVPRRVPRRAPRRGPVALAVGLAQDGRHGAGVLDGVGGAMAARAGAGRGGGGQARRRPPRRARAPPRRRRWTILDAPD